MTISDRGGLISRIRQLRQPAEGHQPPAEGAGEPPADRLQALEARVAYLEQLLEGLQDSVHREAERQDKLISELQAQIQPGAMGASLARDARKRGL